MYKLSVNTFLLLSRRSYAAIAAENVRAQQPATAAAASVIMGKVNKAAEVSSSATVEQKEEYWMRDPKTGNWVPESHFNEIDVTELRAKYLSKKD